MNSARKNFDRKAKTETDPAKKKLAEAAAKANTPKSGGGDGGIKKSTTALDREAKAANKEADRLAAKWRKGGMKDDELRAKVKEADKKAKDLDKQADKADAEFQSAMKKREKAKPDPDQRTAAQKKTAFQSLL